GDLFSGKKFFLTQRIPLRSRYVKDVETNGGAVVKLETQADYIIADHLRNDAPVGSISYTFIEKAIKDGKLPPEEDHMAARPRGTIRSAGPSAPIRSMRTAFTDADDKELFIFVKNAEAQGVAIKGQELYKELEAINSRHTWQSWRERWLKQFDMKSQQPSRQVKHVKSRVSPIEDDQIHTMNSAEGVVPLPEPEVTADQSAKSLTMSGFENENIKYWLLGKARELYTQDIFDAPTQQPDFEVPEPGSQFDTHTRQSGPVLDSQSVDGEAVDVFVATQISRGLDDKEVWDALYLTSFHLDLCLLVLDAKVNKTEVPIAAGIWTEQEDQWLEGTDAVMLRQLEEKHGEQKCLARRDFLINYRE
ncbi:Rap1 Myb domain-containing protein, partial [Delphinella strobiligena]